MLILQRKLNERITLVIEPSDKPTTVSLMVTKFMHGKVKLGFDGPASVKILREEISDEPPRERIASAIGNRPQIVSE